MNNEEIYIRVIDGLPYKVESCECGGTGEFLEEIFVLENHQYELYEQLVSRAWDVPYKEAMWIIFGSGIIYAVVGIWIVFYLYPLWIILLIPAAALTMLGGPKILEIYRWKRIRRAPDVFRHDHNIPSKAEIVSGSKVFYEQ